MKLPNKDSKFWYFYALFYFLFGVSPLILLFFTFKSSFVVLILMIVYLIIVLILSIIFINGADISGGKFNTKLYGLMLPYNNPWKYYFMFNNDEKD